MILIALFLTLLILISYPIIGFKIIKAIKGKNKQKLYRLSTLLIILVLIPGFYWRKLPGSDLVWRPIEKIQEKNYNQELTGFEFYDGKSIFEFEGHRSFNGDGYSIWIYELEENTETYFKNPNDEFFSNYPRTELRDHWKSKLWHRTPFDKKEQKFVDFAHISLDDLDFELTDLLNEDGNYYGYEYYMHDFIDGTTYVGDIDFYIICPNRKMMIKINHNT
jgi:hypothetical protein